MGAGAGLIFNPNHFRHGSGFCSTRPEPHPLPSLAFTWTEPEGTAAAWFSFTWAENMYTIAFICYHLPAPQVIFFFSDCCCFMLLLVSLESSWGPIFLVNQSLSPSKSTIPSIKVMLYSHLSKSNNCLFCFIWLAKSHRRGALEQR
jgi:hypothetical protein